MKFKKFEESEENKQDSNVEKNNIPEINEKKIPENFNLSKEKSLSNFSHFSLENEKNKEEIFAMGNFLDQIGFTRYHALIFILSALIIMCGGTQEVILTVVLSMVNQKKKLSDYEIALFTSSEYAGLMSAYLLVNIICNYISNKKTIQIFSILGVLFTGISIVSLTFYLTVCSRYLLGFSLGVLEVLIYLNLIESSPTKIRGFIGSFIMIFSPLGTFIVTLFCFYSLQDNNSALKYNYFLIFPFIMSSVTVLITIFFLEESPRRTAALQDIEGSAKIIRKMSKYSQKSKFVINKEDIIDKKRNIDKNSNDSYSSHARESFFIYLAKMFNKKYIQMTLLLWISSLLSGFLFNGIFYLVPTYSLTFDKNEYKDVLFSISMEIPSILLASILIENKHLGRLRIMKISNFLLILICLIFIFYNDNKLILNLLLKFFSSITSNVLFIYSSEIYEVNLRTVGMSTINFWRRIATISSPFIVTLISKKYGEIGPYYIFLPISLVLFVLSLFYNIETCGVSLELIEIPIEENLI